MAGTYETRRIPRLLTVDEVAASLRISPRGVRRLAELGHLPAVRICEKRLRFAEPDLIAYLDRRHAGANGCSVFRRQPAQVLRVLELEEVGFVADDLAVREPGMADRMAAARLGEQEGRSIRDRRIRGRKLNE